MLDTVIRDLVQFERYVESQITHSPERTFLVLGGVLLALGWLFLRGRHQK